MKTIIISIISLLLIGCKSSSLTLDENRLSEYLCLCFQTQTSGTTDEKMKPCLDEYLNSKEAEIRSIYPNLKYDSLISATMLNVLVLMVRNCDQFYVEVDSMYHNTYPLDTSASMQNQIAKLDSEINITINVDSLNTQLYLQVQNFLQIRKYDKAIEYCNKIIEIKPEASGTYLCLAYAFDALKEYDKSIMYLDKTIELSENKDYLLQKEITLRRKRNGN